MYQSVIPNLVIRRRDNCPCCVFVSVAITRALDHAALQASVHAQAVDQRYEIQVVIGYVNRQHAVV